MSAGGESAGSRWPWEHTVNAEREGWLPQRYRARALSWGGGGLGCAFRGLEARVAEVWLWVDGGRALFACCLGTWIAVEPELCLSALRPPLVSEASDIPFSPP